MWFINKIFLQKNGELGKYHLLVEKIFPLKKVSEKKIVTLLEPCMLLADSYIFWGGATVLVLDVKALLSLIGLVRGYSHRSETILCDHLDGSMSIHIQHNHFFLVLLNILDARQSWFLNWELIMLAQISWRGNWSWTKFAVINSVIHDWHFKSILSYKPNWW